MSDDLRTIVWKEWRSLLHGQSRRQLLIMSVMLAFWALWLPIQTGEEWMTDGVISIIISVLLPGLVVSVTVPPAFAGERERKTLATLLTTRLPDDAILFGKLVIPVSLGSVSMFAVLLVGLIAANAASWDGSPRFYDPVVIVPNLFLGFLVSVMVSALGVAISLRAKRVQDAQQMISLMLMVPAVGLGALLFVLAEMTGGLASLTSRFEDSNGRLVAFVAVALFTAVDAALLAIARRRFKRSHLITLT